MKTFEQFQVDISEGMTTQMLTGILPAARGVDLTTIPSGSPDSDGNYTAFSIMGDMTTAEDPTGVGCWFRHPDFDFGNPDRASIQSFHGGTYSSSESSDSGSGKEGQVAGYVPRSMRLVRPSGNWLEVGQPYQPVFGDTNDLIGATSIGTALQFSQDGYMATKNIDTSDVDTLKIHAFVSSSSRIIASDKVELFYWAGNKTGFKSTWTGAAYSDGEGHESGHLKNNDGWRRINTKPDGTVDNTVQTKIIDHLRPNSKNGKLSAYTIHLPEWTRGKNSRFIITSFGSSSATFQMTSMRFQRNNTIRVPSISKPLTDVEASPFVRVGQSVDQNAEQRKKKVRDMIKSSIKYGDTKFGKGMLNSTNISESKKVGLIMKTFKQFQVDMNERVNLRPIVKGIKSLTSVKPPRNIDPYFAKRAFDRGSMIKGLHGQSQRNITKYKKFGVTPTVSGLNTNPLEKYKNDPATLDWVKRTGYQGSTNMARPGIDAYFATATKDGKRQASMYARRGASYENQKLKNIFNPKKDKGAVMDVAVNTRSVRKGWKRLKNPGTETERIAKAQDIIPVVSQPSGKTGKYRLTQQLRRDRRLNKDRRNIVGSSVA